MPPSPRVTGQSPLPAHPPAASLCLPAAFPLLPGALRRLLALFLPAPPPFPTPRDVLLYPPGALPHLPAPFLYSLAGFPVRGAGTFPAPSGTSCRSRDRPGAAYSLPRPDQGSIVRCAGDRQQAAEADNVPPPADVLADAVSGSRRSDRTGNTPALSTPVRKAAVSGSGPPS